MRACVAKGEKLREKVRHDLIFQFEPSLTSPKVAAAACCFENLDDTSFQRGEDVILFSNSSSH